MQTAGHLGKTHVEEVRRSARAKIHSIFYRDFKIWALDLMRKEDEEERKHLEDEARLRAEQDGDVSAPELHNNKKQPRRRMKVEGKKRLELHAQWIDAKCQEIDDGIAFLEAQEVGIMADIMAEMLGEHKSSRLADDDKLTTYNRAATKQRDRTVESKHLQDMTPWMNGSVILSYLYEKDGARPFVLAEIKKRDIKYKPVKAIKDMTKKELAKHKKQWEGCSIKQMTIELKKHEHARLGADEGIHLKDYNEVKNIKPLSQKLQQWMPKQWEIYKRKKGQVHDNADD